MSNGSRGARIFPLDAAQFIWHSARTTKSLPVCCREMLPAAGPLIPPHRNESTNHNSSMIVIRLTRVGKTKQPSYRVVVQDKRKDPWGKAIEIVGRYNPRTKPKTITLMEDRIKFWLSKGAEASPTVHNLLVDAKLIKAEKKQATSHDKPKKEGAEKPAEEKKAA